MRKFILPLIILSVSLQAFPQESSLREEIHRRIMDKLLRGIGPDHDLFSDLDQMFEEGLELRGSAAYATSWVEGEKGRTLLITPKDPEQKLDINVENGLISIKGKEERKTEFGTSIRSFANSFSVPHDVDPSKVEISQKEGKILVSFPFRQKAPGTDRYPVPAGKDDVTI